MTNLTRLTVREKAVLTHFAHGRTSEEAAKAINVSQETAKAALRTARIKLGAGNRTHAVAIAVQRGLIRVDDPYAEAAA